EVSRLEGTERGEKARSQLRKDFQEKKLAANTAWGSARLSPVTEKPEPSPECRIVRADVARAPRKEEGPPCGRFRFAPCPNGQARDGAPHRRLRVALRHGPTERV